MFFLPQLIIFIILLILVSVLFWCCIVKKKEGRILDQGEEENWHCAFYVNSDVSFFGGAVDCRMTECLSPSVSASDTPLTLETHAVFPSWCWYFLFQSSLSGCWPCLLALFVSSKSVHRCLGEQVVTAERSEWGSREEKGFVLIQKGLSERIPFAKNEKHRFLSHQYGGDNWLLGWLNSSFLPLPCSALLCPALPSPRDLQHPIAATNNPVHDHHYYFHYFILSW